MASGLWNSFITLALIFASGKAATLRGNPICSGATPSDHLVPHPTDCHLFYSCSEDGSGDYEAYLFSCPDGLAFDDTVNRCEFEEYVPRCKQDSTTAPTTTMAPTTTHEPETTTPEDPATTTSEEPETTTPDDPATTTPEEPQTTTPESPATTTPEVPQTTTSEEPETTTPEDPETTTPEAPETSTPVEPETTTPADPATTSSEEPETSTPEEPEPTTTEQATTTGSPVFTSTTCENNQGFIGCQEGKVVKVISGYYGRQDQTLCPHPSIQTTSCYSNRLEYIQSECEGQNSCNFTSNNRFGDPCVHTYKYTEVQYSCI